MLRGQRLVFTTLSSDRGEYAEVRDLGDFQAAVARHAAEYEASQGAQTLVLFAEMCEHVARLCRIFMHPGGHALLLGGPGLGRRTVVRLASHISGQPCFAPHGSMDYGVAEWRREAMACLLRAGVEGRAQTLLLSDGDAIFDEVLEDVHRLLDGGDFIDYDSEDLEAIRQAGESAATPAGALAAFLKRVRAKLHLALALRMGAPLRARLRRCPAMAACTADVYEAWPRRALAAVAEQHLGDCEVAKALPQAHAAAEALGRRLEAERRCPLGRVAQTAFLELLRVFALVLAERSDEERGRERRLGAAVAQVGKARSHIGAMEADIEGARPKLEVTRATVQSVISHLEQEREKADVVRRGVVSEEQRATELERERAEREEEATRELRDLAPALKDAAEGLKRIQVSQIRDLKGAKPSQGVMLAVASICMVLGAEPPKRGPAVEDYWAVAQNLLKEPKRFLEDLLLLDAEKVSNEVLGKLDGILEREEFDPAQIKKSSPTCEAMCLWVRVVCRYHEAKHRAAPKLQLLARAQEACDKAKASLEAAHGRLSVVEEAVSAVEESLAGLFQQEQALVKQIAEADAHLERSRQLLQALGEESQRWQQQMGSLQGRGAFLHGDVLLCAALLVYGGPFSATFRPVLEGDCRRALSALGVPHTPQAVALELLVDAATRSRWHLRGLADDSHSLQNAVIVHRARRWPVLVDPQRQGVAFVKLLARTEERKGAGSGLEVVHLGQANLTAVVRIALETGRWVLVEHADSRMDPLLDALVEQRAAQTKPGLRVHVGDKAVLTHAHFRLFFATCCSRPLYPAELLARVTLVHFAVTSKAVEQQLLALLVARERPELERRRMDIAKLSVELRQEVAGTEDSLLEIVAESEGQLLEDAPLTKELLVMRGRAQEEAERLAGWEEAQSEIQRERRELEAVSLKAAAAFSVVQDLELLSGMYRFSYQAFQELVSTASREARKAPSASERLQNLERALVARIFTTISSALLPEHRLLFGFAMGLRLEASRCQEELGFILGEATPHVEELAVLALSELPAFAGLRESIEAHDSSDWERIRAAPHPEDECLPGHWHHSLTGPLDRLCLLRAIRPDALERGVRAFVREQLGQDVENQPSDLHATLRSTPHIIPVLFLLAGGGDPSAELRSLARELQVEVRSLALAPGRAEAATRLFTSAVEIGGWLLLHNCHLLLGWMPTLARLCGGLDGHATHRGFRLWLTSEPTEGLPAPLLQLCVKMARSRPLGVCAQLRDCEGLELGLRHFHAVAAERQRLVGGARYDAEDLSAALRQLRSIAERWCGGPAGLTSAGCVVAESYGAAQSDRQAEVLAALARHCLARPQEVGDADVCEVPVELERAWRRRCSASLVAEGRRLLWGEEALEEEVLVAPEAVACLRARLPPASCLPEVCEGGLLAQEVRQHRRLLELAAASLAELERALSGEATMSEGAECLAVSLQREAVPEAWAVQEAALVAGRSLSAWVSHLEARVSFWGEWAREGKQPAVLWLPAFIRPAQLSTSVCRRFARKAGTSLEHVSLSFEVLQGVDWEGDAEECAPHGRRLKDKDGDLVESPGVGCYLHGLSLVACSWDSAEGLLARASRPSALGGELPPLWLRPGLAEAAEAPRAEGAREAEAEAAPASTKRRVLISEVVEASGAQEAPKARPEPREAQGRSKRRPRQQEAPRAATEAKQKVLTGAPPKPGTRIYQAPLYRESHSCCASHSEPIMDIGLPTLEDPDVWLRSGASLALSWYG